MTSHFAEASSAMRTRHLHFAQEWIEAFNKHDLPAILSHYDDNVCLTSPLYRAFTAGEKDTVFGLEELRRYFSEALARYPELRFTLLEAASGANSLAVYYHTNLGDRTAIECFHLNAEFKAEKVFCHYVAG